MHAADTEIALVRGHMQAGDYRRALAFGAHTAGAHLDVVGGSLLYVWLLHAGGQLIGLALPGRAGQGGDRLVPASLLIKALGTSLLAATPADPVGAKPRALVDKVYEASLKTSLQMIAIR